MRRAGWQPAIKPGSFGSRRRPSSSGDRDSCDMASCRRPENYRQVGIHVIEIVGWGGRVRTSAWRNQNPLPYHLATPQKTGEHNPLPSTPQCKVAVKRPTSPFAAQAFCRAGVATFHVVVTGGNGCAAEHRTVFAMQQNLPGPLSRPMILRLERNYS